MSRFFKKLHQHGIVHIQSTRNNTIITLTTTQGATRFASSAGGLGFRNTRKSTTYAAHALAEVVATRALALGFSHVTVHVQGLGYGKQSALRALAISRLTIVEIREHTRVPHNGCRAPKKRRV